MKSLDKILQNLQDPDISSSVIPLLVVMLIFFSGSIFALVRILSGMRMKLPEKPEPFSKKFSFLKYFARGRWRELFQIALVPAQPRAEAPPAEIDQLRELVRKLEQANAIERELHAKALRKITELQGELQSLVLQREEEQKLLEFERGRRAKLENKALQLEAQLQGAIKETERIFEQSASQSIPTAAEIEEDAMIAMPDPEVMKKRQATVDSTIKTILNDFPPPPSEEVTPEVVARQAAEIQKLKSVLREIREKMSAPTKKVG